MWSVRKEFVVLSDTSFLLFSSLPFSFLTFFLFLSLLSFGRIYSLFGDFFFFFFWFLTLFFFLSFSLVSSFFLFGIYRFFRPELFRKVASKQISNF